MDAFNDAAFEGSVGGYHEGSEYLSYMEYISNLSHVISRLLHTSVGTYSSTFLQISVQVAQPHIRTKYLLHLHTDDLSYTRTGNDYHSHVTNTIVLVAVVTVTVTVVAIMMRTKSTRTTRGYQNKHELYWDGFILLFFRKTTHSLLDSYYR